MSKDPAFLFYPNDYIGGTMGMTFEEKGAYMELLMMQFNRGHMTSHMIGQTIGQAGGQIWDKIQGKFKKDDNGLFYNERLEVEIEKRKAFVCSRFNNITGKNQYTKRNGNVVGHKTSHMENENVNVDIGGAGEKEKPEISSFNFYSEEVKKAKEFTDQMSRDYVSLCNHICQKNKDGSFRMPFVLKIKNQLSLDEFSKLHDKASKNIDTIISKIDTLQTNVKYHGKYTDIYLTINNWLNK